jgi:hypothetical protein
MNIRVVGIATNDSALVQENDGGAADLASSWRRNSPAPGGVVVMSMSMSLSMLVVRKTRGS